MLNEINSLENTEIDEGNLREAYMEFLHMRTMISLKLERLMGKQDDFVKMANQMETTFMMDTLYINFGVRPNQFHLAIQKYNPLEAPEVKQYIEESERKNRAYLALKERATHLTEEERAHIKSLLGDFKAEQDERGLFSIATYNKINEVQRLANFFSTCAHQ